MATDMFSLMRALALLLILPLVVGGCSGSSESGTSGSVGSGSKFSWDSDKCMTVEGKTEYTWEALWPSPRFIYSFPSTFYITEPCETWECEANYISSFKNQINMLKTLGCGIDASSTISYSTKNWLCAGDTVKINGNECTIDRICSVIPETGGIICP